MLWRFAREQAPERAERTDTLVWGKNAVTELLKSGGGGYQVFYLTDTMPQAVAGYYSPGQGERRGGQAGYYPAGQ